MRITEIHVGRYGPLVRRTVEVEPGVHVLYGPNEAGKTLFLEATLRLVEPDIPGVMPGVSRIEEEPHGYVRASGSGETDQVDGDESLFAGTDVEPAHLANIFIVRESALTLLAEEHNFYSSLTEHIGELHTSALDRIEDELLERGRLTRTRRELSSAEGRDNAEGVRERANSLREEIEAYVEQAETEGLDELEGQLVAARARLDRLAEEVEALEQAESLHRHRRLESRLEEYRGASEKVEQLAALTREDLLRLHSRRDAIEGERERISSLREEIEEHERRIAALGDRIDQKQDELAPLEEREAHVQHVASRLDDFREGSEPANDLRDTERVVLWTGIGFLGAGCVLQAVALIVGAGLDAVALIAAGLGAGGLAGYGLLRHRRRQAEAERHALAHAAAEAGLEAEEPREVAAEIRHFRSRVEGIGQRIDTLADRRDDHRTRLDTLRSEIEKSRKTIEERKEEIDGLLGDAGMDSVEEYEAALDRKEEAEEDRSEARTILAEALGDPDADDWRGEVEAWEEELSAIVEGIEVAEAAHEYDPSTHEEKRATLQEREAETSSLSVRLEEHRDRIARFERRVRDNIDAEPFLGSRIELEAMTTDGLRRLAKELDDLVDRIDHDADVSGLLLNVVDELRAEEERKITDLFAVDGPATEAFRRISDGRYREVRYDPDDRTLLVSDAEGRELTPEQLSKGARDQMYLAARVGLANRLLGGDRGFFILDDPLVAADRERLSAAFRVLQSLADEGWQILYFTAKEEVRHAMVEEFSLPLTTFDARL